ncbi:MAG: DUF362 domain-containing protein [Oscillospiraceae bacterium]|jgi:uncharacterized protein (DUF362 family)/ferredoxin|nr:DUF362 domain-containing protein [Oscillospiraceae bacterium]
MDNRVFLARCGDYDRESVGLAVRRILDGLGGIASFNIKGKKVLIKANLLSPYPPERAVTTHPAVVAALAREFIAAGGTVTIADSPGGGYSEGVLKKLYKASGMTGAAEITGAALSYDTGSKTVSYPEAIRCKKFDIIDPVLDADFVISAAKLKTHGLVYYTGAVKNLFGSVPGFGKAAMHSKYFDRLEFCEMLCDVCDYIKPGLSIIDGVDGMEGNGPSGGSVKHVGALGGSLNPYALDLAMCSVVSLPAKRVPTLVTGMKKGYIPGEISSLSMLGDDYREFLTQFIPAAGGDGKNAALSFVKNFVSSKIFKRKSSQSGMPYPEMLDNCIACKKCAEICPRQVITVADGKASPELSGCIRCYCCHEICPVQAIALTKKRKTPSVK